MPELMRNVEKGARDSTSKMISAEIIRNPEDQSPANPEFQSEFSTCSPKLRDSSIADCKTYKKIPERNSKDDDKEETSTKKQSTGSSSIISDEHQDWSWKISTTASAVKDAEYAVRGRVPEHAECISRKTGAEITHLNIGNPQQLGQQPLTYLRQLMALVEYPDLESATKNLFPEDVVKRSKLLITEIKSSGAYTHSQGIASVRQHVADFISQRDGCATSPKQIFLTSGASSAASMVIQCLLDKPSDGIMIPVPQYPLYSALVTLCKGTKVPYFLNESIGWSCDINELDRCFSDAVSQDVHVRAVVVINPGNPTGGVMSKDVMVEVLQFAASKKVVLIADEVYQENIHAQNSSNGFPWVSFRKVLAEFEQKECAWAKAVQLVSLHSVSKGLFGECGKRGGYMELHNIGSQVLAQIYKLASINLCSSVAGQIAVDVMVKPPCPGDPSYPLWDRETKEIRNSLARRAKILHEALAKLPGVSCVPAAGALYLFPNLTMPEGAIKRAKELGVHADELYCLELVEKTNLCMVPGSGFLQKPGTHHLRTTFLAGEHMMPEIAAKITEFHNSFMRTYGSSSEQI